jgi:spermidine synthase
MSCAEVVARTGPRRNAMPAFDPDDFIVEWLTDDAGTILRRARTIESAHTRYQHLEVVDTPALGTMFRLDGSNMTSEHDEFFYHENIVHPGVIAQDAPLSALIVGGGDGGAAEELLKHPSMRRVVIAELDADVIRIARAHLQRVHRGSLDDARVEIHVVDALEYVRSCRETFDAIVMDLTDPMGPAEALYTSAFYASLARLLTPSGTLAVHIGAPFFHRGRFVEALARLSSVFAIVRPYLVDVPLYGASWGMACVSQRTDPLVLSASAVDVRIAERRIGDLQYYNGDVHRGMFALPNYVQSMVRTVLRTSG